MDNRFLAEKGFTYLKDLYEKQPAWAVAGISKYDSDFLCGLISEIKPKKILEIGVASGWSSACMLHTMKRTGENFIINGVDIAERFFYDENYATGQVISEIIPDMMSHIKLYLGKTISEIISEIGGGIDFVFIDAHHMHPWATLDFLVVLPYLNKDAYVAFHDISLSQKEDQQHQNRGPKYIFGAFLGDSIISIQEPSMIGAVKITKTQDVYLAMILDVLYSSFEIEISQEYIKSISAVTDKFFGIEYGDKIRHALEIGNYNYNMLKYAFSNPPGTKKVNRIVNRYEAIKMKLKNQIKRFK